MIKWIKIKDMEAKEHKKKHYKNDGIIRKETTTKH